MISRRISIYVIFILLSMIIYGCSVVKHEPIPLVKYVDLDKFMGSWYVIAHIPSYPEKNAFNAVETYKLNENGTIATTFTFNEGGYNGSLKVLNPTGFIIDNQSTNYSVLG